MASGFFHYWHRLQAQSPNAKRYLSSTVFRAMLVARTIATPMLLIIGFWSSFPVVVAVHWIRSGLMRLADPLYMASAMEQFDESERATGSSLMRMSWDVGWSAALARPCPIAFTSKFKLGAIAKTWSIC